MVETSAPTIRIDEDDRVTDTVALDRGRQARLDRADLGLHLVERIDRIDAFIEGQHDRGAPGRGGRDGIEQPVEARQRVLDPGRDRVLDRPPWPRNRSR